MMGGGLLWAFDVGGVEELKRRVEGRRRGVDGRWKGRGKDDDEEGEFEKWVASLTGRGEREEEKGGRRRRWSAQEANEEEEGRAREGRFAVVEAQATNERRKPR